MPRATALLAGAALALAGPRAARAAYCSGAPDPAATPNAYPVFKGDGTLLNTTK